MIVHIQASIIATKAVVKALPDGYMLHYNGSIPWLAPLLQEARHDAVRDLLPVTLANDA